MVSRIRPAKSHGFAVGLGVLTQILQFHHGQAQKKNPQGKLIS